MPVPVLKHQSSFHRLRQRVGLAAPDKDKKLPPPPPPPPPKANTPASASTTTGEGHYPADAATRASSSSFSSPDGVPADAYPHPHPHVEPARSRPPEGAGAGALVPLASDGAPARLAPQRLPLPPSAPPPPPSSHHPPRPSTTMLKKSNPLLRMTSRLLPGKRDAPANAPQSSTRVDAEPSSPPPQQSATRPILNLSILHKAVPLPHRDTEDKATSRARREQALRARGLRPANTTAAGKKLLSEIEAEENARIGVVEQHSDSDAPSEAAALVDSWRARNPRKNSVDRRSSTDAGRKSSVDAGRKNSIDAGRKSGVDASRKGSVDASRKGSVDISRKGSVDISAGDSVEGEPRAGRVAMAVAVVGTSPAPTPSSPRPQNADTVPSSPRSARSRRSADRAPSHDDSADKVERWLRGAPVPGSPTRASASASASARASVDSAGERLTAYTMPRGPRPAPPRKSVDTEAPVDVDAGASAPRASPVAFTISDASHLSGSGSHHLIPPPSPVLPSSSSEASVEPATPSTTSGSLRLGMGMGMSMRSRPPPGMAPIIVETAEGEDGLGVLRDDARGILRVADEHGILRVTDERGVSTAPADMTEFGGKLEPSRPPPPSAFPGSNTNSATSTHLRAPGRGKGERRSLGFFFTKQQPARSATLEPTVPHGGRLAAAKSAGDLRRGVTVSAPSREAAAKRTPAVALAPTMHSQASIVNGVQFIADDESRRLSELAFVC